MAPPPAIDEKRVRANGLEIAYLEAGAGPLIVCLHGFPDNAWSWEHQIPRFAEAGFRIVAPFLRGYAPTEVPASGYYDRATLALDVRELIRALGGGEPAVIVAQDWGAGIAYGVLGAFPEVVRRAVVMAIPHPGMLRLSLMSPAQIHRAFHWWFFQLPQIPELAVAANDFAFIDYLWDCWSPEHRDRAHVTRVKRTLASPGSLEAAIGYYRAAFNPAAQDPALGELRAALDKPIGVPTLALCGSKDIRTEMMEGQREFFTGRYAYEVLPDCGHFLHRERPEEVTRAVLAWLRE